MPDDVFRFVLREFPPGEEDEALSLLRSAVTHTGEPAGDRLLRCAAVASHGNLERLTRQVDQLKRDYRDVIVAGEYESRGGKLVRVRDLTQPIP